MSRLTYYLMRSLSQSFILEQNPYHFIDFIRGFLDLLLLMWLVSLLWLNCGLVWLLARIGTTTRAFAFFRPIRAMRFWSLVGTTRLTSTTPAFGCVCRVALSQKPQERKTVASVATICCRSSWTMKFRWRSKADVNRHRAKRTKLFPFACCLRKAKCNTHVMASSKDRSLLFWKVKVKSTCIYREGV